MTYWLHTSEIAVHRARVVQPVDPARAAELSVMAVEMLPDHQGRDQVLFRAALVGYLVVARDWPLVESVAAGLVGAPRGGSARVAHELRQAWVGLRGARPPDRVRDAVRAALEAHAGR